MPSFGAPYAPSENDLPARIGPYRVVRLLATGRTSDILLAREEGPHGFERVVVLKTLLPRLRDDSRFSRMFVREACAYTRVSHPAVGRLLHLLDDRGELALVLEYVEGLPLHHLRAELHRAGDRLRDDAALFLAFRLFSALGASHTARDPLSGEFSPVVHADVNPSNVIVPWDGYAKLIDFGSAKVAGAIDDAAAGPSPRTYLAPEQARGDGVTVRSDLYSACLILWELLTGRRAIARGRESNGEIVTAMAQPNFPSLAALRPDLPKAVHDFVGRGLRPDPDQRDLFAEDACEILRTLTNLNRARSGLVEALAGLRFASIDEDRLGTTPNLPAFDLPRDRSVPEIYVPHASDRPVVLPAPVFPLPYPRARRPWIAAASASFAVACGVGLLLALGRSASTPVTIPESASKTSLASRPPIAPTAPLPSPTPPAPAIPSSSPPLAPAPLAVATTAAPNAPPPDRATVTVPPERAGHRVWIDGRLVGQSPGTFKVRCGTHAVRVGSKGSLHRIHVDCGADVTVR